MQRGLRWSQNEEGPLGGPKAKEAPWPMRCGPRWSESEGGPPAHVAGASVEAKEAPSPMWRGLRWCQREGGLLTHRARAALVPKRRRPLVDAAEASAVPK